MGLLFLVAGVACKGTTENNNITPCTAAGTPVNLAVGQYTSVDATSASGCTVFPANGAVPAEYLIVPQLGTGTPGGLSSFRVDGDTIRPAMSVALFEPTRELSPAERFHRFLREGDERGWRGFVPKAGAPEQPRRSSRQATITYGDVDNFKTCSNLDCTATQTVAATARAVKTKVVIFTDNTVAFGGLDSARLDTLAELFESRLYASDTAAFGRESDIDANGVVLVLMTPRVNSLVSASQCQRSGFVAGYFYGADLIPTHPNSNDGEIFYSLVADPNGTFSCSHSTTSVQRIVPVTFVHEFQHMISFNQHVLVRGGAGEVLWLNEGFSHYAEELAARTYPNGSTEFSRFAIGNLFNAYQYLDSTKSTFLLASEGIGSLAERGAAWLFVRYIVDRHSGGSTLGQWNTFTRSMVETNATGAANVAARAGLPFETVVARWALANWVSDLTGFTAPTELKYDSWAFRTTYASLNAQDANNFPKAYPLTPTVSAGRDVAMNGTLRAGSGSYHRATQGPTVAGFTLSFTTSDGGVISSSLVPRLNVIRIQ